METKYAADQAVASDDLTTMALPANKADIMGLRRLWKG